MIKLINTTLITFALCKEKKQNVLLKLNKLLNCFLNNVLQPILKLMLLLLIKERNQQHY